MDKSLTIGQLKQAIKDLPDDLPVYASAFGVKSKQLDHAYYIDTAEFSDKSPIGNAYFGINLGEGFFWLNLVDISFPIL